MSAKVARLGQEHFRVLRRPESGRIPEDRLDALGITDHRAAERRAAHAHGELKLERAVGAAAQIRTCPGGNAGDEQRQEHEPRAYRAGIRMAARLVHLNTQACPSS
jgi:hypothetical protein